MPKSSEADQLVAALSNLTEAEIAALPSRLRRLLRPPEADAWEAGKAERDAALAAAYELEDPDERAEAVSAARAAWAERKAELLTAQAEG